VRRNRSVGAKEEAVPGRLIRTTLLTTIMLIEVVFGEGLPHIRVVGEQKPWRPALRASAASAGLVPGLADVTEIGVSTGGNAALALRAARMGVVALHAVVSSEAAVKTLDLRGGLGDAVGEGY
jgi:hypothetical protein